MVHRISEAWVSNALILLQPDREVILEVGHLLLLRCGFKVVVDHLVDCGKPDRHRDLRAVPTAPASAFGCDAVALDQAFEKALGIAAQDYALLLPFRFDLWTLDPGLRFRDD